VLLIDLGLQGNHIPTAIMVTVSSRLTAHHVSVKTNSCHVLAVIS